MSHKELRPLLRELKAQSWVVDKISGTHFKATPPEKEGEVVHFCVSNDPRGIKNTIRDLKRSGFVWPQKKAPKSKRNGARAKGCALHPDGFGPDDSYSKGCTCEVPHYEPEPEELTAEQKRQRLFDRLVETRGYYELALGEEKEEALKVDEAERALAAAREQYGVARDETKRAKEKLLGAKKALDEVLLGDLDLEGNP